MTNEDCTHNCQTCDKKQEYCIEATRNVKKLIQALSLLKSDSYDVLIEETALVIKEFVKDKQYFSPLIELCIVSCFLNKFILAIETSPEGTKHKKDIATKMKTVLEHITNTFISGGMEYFYKEIENRDKNNE